MWPKLNVIPKKELKLNTWYRGKGRNAPVALWNGHTFLTLGNKFGHDVIKVEGLYEEGGCFEPFEEIKQP
jgi:hypothetical protein